MWNNTIMCLSIKIMAVILISSSVEVFADIFVNLTENFYSRNDSQVINNSFVVSIYQQNLLRNHSFVLHFPKLARYILVLRSTRFYGNSSSEESTCYPIKMGVYRIKHSNGDFIYDYPFIQYWFFRNGRSTEFTLIPITNTSVFKMSYLHNNNCNRTSAVAKFFGIVAYDTKDYNTCPNEQNRIHVFYENKNHTQCVNQLDESVYRLLIYLDGITIEESRMPETTPDNSLLPTDVNNSVTTSAPMKGSIETSNDKYTLKVMFIVWVLISSFIIIYLLFKGSYFKRRRVKLRKHQMIHLHPNTPNEALLCSPVPESENKKSAETYFMSYYPLNRDHERGYCMIINIQHFPNNSAMNRDGSDIDRDRLKSTFEGLRYKVLIYNDLNLAEIQSEIKILARIVKPDHDSVVICLLSHGGDQNFIYTSDDRQYQYRNCIMEDLGPENCGALINKPKIVIVQACRGGLMDIDAMKNVSNQLVAPQQSDFLFCYSMIEEFLALENEKKGSLFIQTLCKCISQFHKDKDILDIFTRVNARMKIPETFQSENYPAPYELVTCLTKKFMFG